MLWILQNKSVLLVFILFFELVSQETVQKIHDNGFQVHTWTVNSPEDITFVSELGVDAIISDFPDRL